MRIAVFGLGYVGTVCGACLAHHNHQVTGIDVQSAKVDLVNAAIAPVVEPGLQAMLAAVVGSGHFTATLNIVDAIRSAEVIMLCVGTPSGDDGALNLSFLETVVTQLAAHLAIAAHFPVIAIRSTVPPGTLARCEKLISEISGAVPGRDFAMVSNPEFLREGCALDDFENPSYTLIGTDHKSAIAVMEKLYTHLNAPFMVTSVGVAELIKYVNNSFHALKITFANEVGLLCKSIGVDSHQVMDLLCKDTRLNISPKYLRSGMAYGGSCLPKDLAALNHIAHQQGIKVPVLGHIAESNAVHLAHSIRLIKESGTRRIGILGLSFKAETDDLRESPAVAIVENLLADGFEVRVFDPSINISRLIGANLQFIDSRLQHLSEMLVPTIEDVLAFAETIVVTNNDRCYQDVLTRISNEQTLIDMTRLPGCPPVSEGQYHGICW